ncbi:MAG: TrmO family methyltransferase [Deferribacteraceae bacterium]|jgi:tRNA (Thr-GGU) A37 N-methylase|nr:TrmO family methyltransferase [Deferribacteraceae bacterium]
MKKFNLQQIGTVRLDGEETSIALEAHYAPALRGLDGFSHINIVWWFSECDDCRESLTENSPDKGAPELMGTFATRSPMRPNPLGITCAAITYIDYDNATIGIGYIDAHDGT